MSLAKKIAVLIGDVAVLNLALLAMIFARYRSDIFSRLADHLTPFYFIWVAWLVIFYLTDLYRLSFLRSRSEIIKRVVLAVLVSTLVSVMLFYLFGNFFRLTPKVNLLIFAGAFFVLETVWRFLVLTVLISEKTRIAFWGDASILQETADYLNGNPQVGYEVAINVEDITDSKAEDLAKELKEKKVSLVVVQPKLMKNKKFLAMAYGLLSLKIEFENFLDFYERVFERVPLSEVDESWLIRNIRAEKLYYDKAKGVIDFILASIFLIIFSLLFIVIGLFVAITSGGPVIFKQKRAGQAGRNFMLYKFRTMHNKNKGPLWTEANDKRITPFGKVLRMTHLDELPQLINIIKGDISFIGPRPERVELVEEYSQINYYEVRHIIKPGLTGWAQINFRQSTSVEEASEKLCYDMFYIKNRSLILDLFILLKTVKYVFVQPK